MMPGLGAGSSQSHRGPAYSEGHIATRLSPGEPSPSDQSIKGYDLRSSAAFSDRRWLRIGSITAG
jgi:hypothetical protein